MKIIIIGPNSGMKIIIIWPEFGAYATISNISCDLSISLMHDVDQALLVSVGCSRSEHMALSNTALASIRTLLCQAIKLLQDIIEIIDKSLESGKSTQVYEIRHYCVWAFPPNAPVTMGPGIYSGEHPEVYNTILKEAGLRHKTGALQCKKYNSLLECQICWKNDMPETLAQKGTLPAVPKVWAFYPTTGGPIDDFVVA